MGRTYVRPDEQVRRSLSYLDTAAAGATMESSPVVLEDDLNNLRAQVKRLLGQTNWYDDIGTVNSKQRDVLDLNTDLDDLEEHRILCGVQKLENITVPAAVYATGSITTIADSGIVDGETFVIDDGANAAVTFEFDDNSSVTQTATLRQVVITGSQTADQLRDVIITAIGNAPALNVTASNGGAATVSLQADWAGTHANNTITETVVNVGFVVAGLSSGAGDVVVLSQASSETPSEAAAVGAGTYLGAIVAALSGDVGSWASTNVAGSSSINPKNMVLIRDHDTHDGITSDGRQVFGLLQVENGVIDGDAFNDSDHQAQISFFRINASDAIEPVPGQDIGGQVIEYVYAKRVTLDTLPEDCGWPAVLFTDEAASVAITLDNAIDNQGTTVATQSTDTTIDIDVAGREWAWRDSASAKLFGVIEGAGGGTSTVKVYPDTDVFDSDAAENNFAEGLKVDTGGQEINIGVTAGTIESTGSNDLRLLGAGELYLDDGNQTGSTWAQTAGIKLSDTTAEWDAFETAFGEVSLLNAIVAADASGGLNRTKVVAVVTSAVAADNDVGGPATANNLDVNLTDMSSVTFATDVDIFLNGVLVRNGADAAANHDVYPGSTGVQLKFEFALVAAPGNPDVITQIVWS